ncbi:MAG: 2-hydroxycarboxylate transporter family protein [Fusobacteriaceae bacterium]
METTQHILQKENFKLAGIEMKYFIPISAIIFIASFMGVLPKNMVGAFPFIIIMGAILDFLGNNTPIVKDYFGGGPIVVIFVSAAFVHYGILPETTLATVKNFMTTGGFLDFYIAALIVGSILGMSRKLLVRAALRYLPVIMGGVICSILLTGGVGYLLGYGFTNAIFYIAIPIMGGGMGAGAVPLAQIFGKALKQDPTQLLSVMVPAVALGNAIAIVFGGLLDKLGKRFKNLSGEGKLLKTEGDEVQEEIKKQSPITNKDLGIGLVISTSFFILGSTLGKFINLHPYALMIISVAFAKAFGAISSHYEECATKWYQFVMTNFTAALLVGIGIAYTSLKEVISAFSPTYLALVITTVVGSIIGTAIVGKFMNFYMIEGSITAGLCMANMGGTGDVAVLSAAKRMELMPFAQISSRIGGAFMLILTSLLINLFL